MNKYFTLWYTEDGALITSDPADKETALGNRDFLKAMGRTAWVENSEHEKVEE